MSKRTFMVLQVVSTLVEEVALVAVLLVLLPRFGIQTPVWLIALLGLAWAAWSYLGYRLGSEVIKKPPVIGPETMVGSRCVTTTSLSPEGYVKVGGELWWARSRAGGIDAGVEVVVTEMRGLTLQVVPVADVGLRRSDSRPNVG